MKTLSRLVLPQAPSPIMTSFLEGEDQQGMQEVHGLDAVSEWCQGVMVMQEGRMQQELSASR